MSTILDREYVVKEGKYLHITNLGRVVTQLMEERFSDIADLKFTANMEKKLDDVEEGTVNWKSVLRDFTAILRKTSKRRRRIWRASISRCLTRSPRKSAPSVGGIWW